MCFRALSYLGPITEVQRFQHGGSSLLPSIHYNNLDPITSCLYVQVVLRSLMLTLPSLVDVLLVHLVVWMIFSVLGTNLLGGKFSYCFNETSNKLIHSDLVNNKSICFSLIEQNFTEIRWKTANFNFDNVLASYLTLLLMVSINSL